MSARDDELDDESWDIRETFAYFGRAFYMASVLEVGLAHALMWGEFMVAVRDQIEATRGRGFDQAKYEAEFDAFMNQQFAQTMGNVIRRAERLPYFDDALKGRIQAAKRQRDFLTHHYWREKSIEFSTPAGRAGMRQELLNDAETFKKLDRDIDATMKLARQALGINDDVLEAHSKKKMERVKAGLPWDE